MWTEIGKLVDVQDAPGLIMIATPSALLSGPNVRLYAPFRELDFAIERGQVAFETTVRAFDEAIATPWGLLGLLSRSCYGWLRDSARAARFLDVFIRCWTEIDAVGKRYTAGIPVGHALGSSRISCTTF